jgi:hypothetical protein
VRMAIQRGDLTPDLGGSRSTSQVGQAVCEHMKWLEK